MARAPVVAGQFYPATRRELTTMIAECTPEDAQPTDAPGALVPHAGYVFSGPTAGRTLAQVRIPQTVVLLTPSHSYDSPPCALWTGGAWETPLGLVEPNESVVSALTELSMVTPDDRVHLPEHSGEVVLPFLQYHRRDVRIAVVCITESARAMDLIELARGIARVLDECGQQDALVVASSDMSHERGRDALERVNRQDPLAIAEMERLDPEGLLRVCSERAITMCGVRPAAAMMASARERGAAGGQIVHRATSADSLYGRGDYVVGYAGMIFR